jgi:hypothetical protein
VMHMHSFDVKPRDVPCSLKDISGKYISTADLLRLPDMLLGSIFSTEDVGDMLLRKILSFCLITQSYTLEG